MNSSTVITPSLFKSNFWNTFKVCWDQFTWKRCTQYSVLRIRDVLVLICNEFWVTIIVHSIKFMFYQWISSLWKILFGFLIHTFKFRQFLNYRVCKWSNVPDTIEIPVLWWVNNLRMVANPQWPPTKSWRPIDPEFHSEMCLNNWILIFFLDAMTVQVCAVVLCACSVCTISKTIC